MGKQQVISRFFAPTPKRKNSSRQTSEVPPDSSPNYNRNNNNNSTPFSTSKRKRTHKGEEEEENSPQNSCPPHRYKRRNFVDPSSKSSTVDEHKEQSAAAADAVTNPNSENSARSGGISGRDPGRAGKTGIPGKTFVVSSSSAFPCSDPVLHRKFVDKLLSKHDENGALQQSSYGKPPTGKEKYTPLEEQVVELKSRYKDILLMIEVGYKFRFFGEDAEIAAKELGIFAHYDHNFLTASIPSFRLHVHVRRLVEAGYKVGVVRQTETAALKAHGVNKSGPFTRSLSALYTKATLEAAEALGEGEMEHSGRISSYLMCVVEEEQKILDSNLKKSSAPPIHASASGDAIIGFVAVDPSTGDVIYGQFKDSVTREGLESCLLKVAPVELLLGTPLSPPTEKLLSDFAGPASNVRLERASRERFKYGGALAEVVSFYESEYQGMTFETVDSEKHENVDEGIEVIMRMPELAVQALCLSLQHLKQFKLERILRLGATFREFLCKSEMSLTSNTLQQLEILKSSIDGSENGTLFRLMDHTCTAFGARLLKHWVTHPLCDRNMIRARLEAVSEIAESMVSSAGKRVEGTYPGSGKGGGYAGAASQGRSVGAGCQDTLATVLKSLGKISDIERGITRILHRTATAAEFVSVIHALVTAAAELKQIEPVNSDGSEDEPAQKHPSGIKAHLLKQLISVTSSSTLIEHATRLLSALNKGAILKGEKQKIFVLSGKCFPEVAKCCETIKEVEQNLESLLSGYRKELKIKALEFSSVSGTTHLIEVPSAMRVPSNWIKISSTKKTNRFHPPEVIAGLAKLAIATEQLALACSKAWDNFLGEFASVYLYFRSAVQALASLDCLHSLAILSCNQGYVQPVLLEECDPPQLHIKAGRHPVLESILGESFVPNDTHLEVTGEYCQIITGPNMGGKSCYIRQVALIVIMAQVGSFVPAESMKFNLFNSVFTRMGASDSIQHSSSTFFEELSETSLILQKATSQSLVILDELGRGTSTHDGAAIAYATLHYLLKEKQCMTLFVTHYPKLAELKNEFPGKVNPYYVSYLAEECKTDKNIGSEPLNSPSFQNVSVTANEASQNVTFLYKLVTGLASRSFGLHVARLAQLPDSCINQAATMSAKFENDVAMRMLARLGASSLPANLTMPYASDSNGKFKETKSCPLTIDVENQFTQYGSQISKILDLLESAENNINPEEIMNGLEHAQNLVQEFLSSTNLPLGYEEVSMA